MKSTYSVSSSIRELETDFAAIDRQGFDLIDAKFNDGVWFSAYGKKIGKNSVSRDIVTAWRGEPTFRGFTQRVEELEDKGYELTDVEVTDDGYWLGIFASEQLESELITARTRADFDRQVDALQAQDANSVLGYQVVDIEYADGLLIGVLDRNSSDADYSFSRNGTEFGREVARQREAGLELTNVEYVDGAWYGVFSDELTGLSIPSSRPHTSIRSFEAEISDYQSRGYDLINIESIEGDWLGIYKENVDGTDDIITPSDREAIADPVQNTLRTITQQTMLDATFDP